MNYIQIKTKRISSLIEYQLIVFENGEQRRLLGFPHTLNDLGVAQELAKLKGTVLELKVVDNLKCVKCGRDCHDAYMAENRVWGEAGLGPGVCHLGCLEDLLGRPLVVTDFPPLPINDALLFGMKMGKEAR